MRRDRRQLSAGRIGQPQHHPRRVECERRRCRRTGKDDVSDSRASCVQTSATSLSAGSIGPDGRSWDTVGSLGSSAAPRSKVHRLRAAEVALDHHGRRHGLLRLRRRGTQEQMTRAIAAAPAA